MNSWIQQAIFYHIYPLGFCGAPFENDFVSEPVFRLKKIEAWIGHLKKLNVNALYLGPIFESTSHGYDTIDYYKIDRRLGTNEEFAALVKKLHENGIKVILDGVFNHVGRDCAQFVDLKQKGQASQYSNWFANVNFGGRSPYDDNFSYEGWNGYYNLVKLNLYNPDVKNHIFNAIKFWVNEFSIDGIRLDAADCIDLNFLKELAWVCKSINPELFVFGEVIHGDYNRWANKDSIDSVTNYECYKGLYSSHNEKNYFEIAYSLNRQFGDGGIYKNLPLYNFVDNHDVNRIGSTLVKREYIYPLYAILYTMPGIPSIYYGSEWGIEGKKTNTSDAPLRPELDLDYMNENAPYKDLPEIIATYGEIRLNSKALQKGSYKQVLINNKHFVFQRQYEDECIIVAVNLDEAAVYVDINLDCDGAELVDLFNQGSKFELNNRRTHMDIPAFGVRIMKLEKNKTENSNTEKIVLSI